MRYSMSRYGVSKFVIIDDQTPKYPWAQTVEVIPGPLYAAYQTLGHYNQDRRAAFKRRALKRQLRRAGIEIPDEIMKDLHALRALHKQIV